MLGSSSEAARCVQAAFVDPRTSQMRAVEEDRCVPLRGAVPLVHGRKLFFLYTLTSFQDTYEIYEVNYL